MESSQVPPLSPTGPPKNGATAAASYVSIAARRRATLSLSDLRTPLVENLMSMLPSGHDKAFKYALYNVLALILAAVCVTTLWAAYCILEPFIVPLLWALLCGSVIHPFKDRLVTFTREWLGMVKASPTPLSLQFTFIPFRAIDSISESIGTRVVTWWKYILVGCGGFFLTYLIYHNPPVTLGLILYWITMFLIKTLLWFISWINFQIVLAVSVVYLGAILHCIYIPPSPAKQVNPSSAPSLPQIKKERCGETEKIAEEADPGGTKELRSSANHPPYNPDPKDRLMMRTLALVTWFLWFSYFCRLLPYPLLLIVFVSMVTGTVVYIRKRPIVPSITTKYTAFLSLFGVSGGRLSTQSSRGVSRKGSVQQFSKSRRNTQLIGTPSPGGAQIFQLKQSSSDTPISGMGGGGEGPGEQPVGAEILGIKKLRPPMDLKIEQHCMSTPYTSSGDIMANYSEDTFPSLADSEFGTGSEDEVDGVLDSNKFLYGVLCACLIVQIWHRLWLVHLLPIPVVYFGVKRICISFGLKDYVEKTVCRPFLEFYTAKSGPSRDLFPNPVRVFFRIIYEADRKFISVFESYLDMVATIVILVAVVVISVIFLIFVATQFYAEGDHLVRVAANVINSTVSQYPEISQMLPEGWESLTDSIIGNAYHYGRDYIKTMIRDSVAERNPSKAEEMERQVIELWDRIYLSWNRTWGTLEIAGTEAIGSSGSSTDSQDAKALDWEDIVKTSQNVTDWFDTSMLVNYVKSNYGQLRAVVESVYTVLVGNVSLALSAITSTLSVLFGGGTAILNLIISFIVFFTALFYLLSASTSVYKPVQLFNTWFPGDGKHSSSFVAALEESVSGVFSATLKMSAFYGMWTWLIHTLFQVNIVFVPSFFAAIFAAVPFLMPYWAAFPAVLELWLIQGQWTKALIMLGAQMAPMSLVDAQIYSEIKGGGHPYLTALAVAGGIFCFGFQGAIMGPVVLCVLFVAVKVSSSYMKEGTQLEFQ